MPKKQVMEELQRLSKLTVELEDMARRDSLTDLYNNVSGRKLATEYLRCRDPFSSCGLMIVDIDYFKNVNDIFGHLFGDHVLKRLAELLRQLFYMDDILIRIGGDEFAVLLKDISHSMLVQKSVQLVEAARRLDFEEKDYRMTVSVGVCFLPENAPGYTYDQMFSNADRALYKAKENGRNQYAFCDNLQYFELQKTAAAPEEIDARYLRNDIVATAFEIFEKSGNFNTAISLLLKVIGIRFDLDRITVINTDIGEKSSSRRYQWTSENTPEVLQVKAKFTRKDFLTLFHSYDEYGTTVLQDDNMEMYSESARNLLMQGNARTVVYAAMYIEGRYTGAISYVVCKNRRYWSVQNRKEFGELTKIIAAYLSRYMLVNAPEKYRVLPPDVDLLTGLLSFSRFREDVEQKIVAGYAASHALIFCDMTGFSRFNAEFGYTSGDDLLIAYSRHMMDHLLRRREAYFSRVTADQFLIFMPYERKEELIEKITALNEDFIEAQKKIYPGMTLKVRTGICFITPEFQRASEVIDAADKARRQAREESEGLVCVYK